jgi:hypothetical protein
LWSQPESQRFDQVEGGEGPAILRASGGRRVGQAAESAERQQTETREGNGGTVPSMLPSRLELASTGLRAAVQEIAAGEERALAFLDAYSALPEDERGALPQAVAALDQIDLALRDLRLALEGLEQGAGIRRGTVGGAGGPPMVQLRERRR